MKGGGEKMLRAIRKIIPLLLLCALLQPCTASPHPITVSVLRTSPTSQVSISLVNTGTKDLYDVRAVVEFETSAFWGWTEKTKEYTFGTLSPNSAFAFAVIHLARNMTVTARGMGPISVKL